MYKNNGYCMFCKTFFSVQKSNSPLDVLICPECQKKEREFHKQKEKLIRDEHS